MSAEYGWIYVVGSVGLAENIYKIGCSTNDPLERARKLSTSTSLPLPMNLLYSQRVESPFQIEAAIHRILDKYRVNDSREFFRYPLHQIIELIERYEEVRDEFNAGDGLDFAELFATFPDDGSPRCLTADEQSLCRELERKIAR